MTKFRSYTLINLRKAIPFITRIDTCMIKRFKLWTVKLQIITLSVFKKIAPKEIQTKTSSQAPINRES